QGALPSVPRSVQDPLTSNAVNVEGTLNVILAARDHGVRRVVFASSSSVYGDVPGMPRRETQPIAPLAPYAVAKLAAERYTIVALHDSHTLNELVATLNGLLGTDLEPHYLPPRPGDVPHSMADISLAQEVLGYAPTVDFAAGLERTIEWIGATTHLRAPA